MSQKICLVTGATMGIGKVSAHAFAKQGHRVVLVGRNPERTAAVVDEVKRASGNDAVESLLADLSSLADVRRLAAEFTARHDTLDVLLNNAGAINGKRELTKDGFELTFAVNHLAYFVLTNLLLPVLERTGKPGAAARIVSVASGAHNAGRLDLDDLQSEKKYQSMIVYGTTKLENIMFTYELARRLAGKPVTANCLHPGFVHSGFAANEGGIIKVAVSLTRLFQLSPERGARTQIWAATAPELEGVSGKYFIKCKEARSSKASYDEAAQQRLWDESAKLTGVGA